MIPGRRIQDSPETYDVRVFNAGMQYAAELVLRFPVWKMCPADVAANIIASKLPEKEAGDGA